MWHTILLVLALVLFLVSGAVPWPAPNPPYVWWGRLLSFGLAAWVGAELVTMAVHG